MLEMLALLAGLLAQDPQAAPKTVEDRVRELAVRLATLEKKEQGLAQENAVLLKQLAERAAARENLLRQVASTWVKTYAAAAGLGEPQSREIEELWYGWGKEDLEKPADPARWKAREEVLRGKLSPDQAARLGRKVREVQEQGAKMTLGLFTGRAIGPEKETAVENAVVRKLRLDDLVLLPQAHAEKMPSWVGILGALDESLPDLAPTLSSSELDALRRVIAQWKQGRK